MSIRVLLVDDHPVVRSGLRALLSSYDDLLVVGDADNGEGALSAARDLVPDVLVSDLRLGPGPDGADLAEALRAGADGPAVVILTTYDNDADLVRCLRAGASAYLLKDADPSEIVAAVRLGAAGRSAFTEAQLARVTEAMRRTSIALSDREGEVLALVATGASNRDIARALFLSEATVKSHLNRAFTKLGVDSRTAAVAVARSLDLLD